MKKVDLVYLGTTSGMVGLVYSYAKELEDADLLETIILSKSNELLSHYVTAFGDKVVIVNSPSKVISALNFFAFMVLFVRLLKFTRRSNHFFIPSMHPWLVAMLPVLSFMRNLSILIHDARPHEGDRAWLVEFVNRTVLRYSRLVLFCSKRQLLYAKSNYGSLRSAKIVRHPLFHHYTNSILKCGERRDIVFLGRLETYKGLDVLLDALNYLDPTVIKRIKVFGKGNTDIVSQLGDSVYVENRYIPDLEIPIILNSASMILLPYKSATQSGLLTLAGQFKSLAIITPVPDLIDQSLYACDTVVAADFTGEAYAKAIKNGLQILEQGKIIPERQYLSGIVEAFQ